MKRCSIDTPPCQAAQHGRSASKIAHPARGQETPDRSANGSGVGMKFGGHAALGTTHQAAQFVVWPLLSTAGWSPRCVP